MKKAIFCIFPCLLAAFLGCEHDNSRTNDVVITDSVAPEPEPIDTMGVLVAHVQQQNRLYTAECQVHKVVLFSDEASVGGRLFEVSLPGYRKAAVPIDVTLKAYVDFSEFDSGNVAFHDSLCIVTLPDPQVVITASKVDHTATRQYVSMARSKFSEAELSRLAAQGEDSIAAHIASFGIQDRARESCARTLIPLLTRLGFSEQNVVIRFRKKFDNSELRPLRE